MNTLLFESVCGGHFNPAVTICTFFMEKRNWKKNSPWIILYFAAQFSGAFVGALFAISTIPNDELPLLRRATYENGEQSTYGVFMVEMLYSMLFILVVTYQKYDPSMLTPGTFLDAVACGLAFFVAIACTEKTSGGCINPAIGFALTVTASLFDI